MRVSLCIVIDRNVLSEAASKELLREFSIPFASEREVTKPAEAVRVASEFGYPVVVKLCGESISHKTERGLVRLHLGDAVAVEKAATELLAMARPEDGPVSLLVSPMIAGGRELIAGVLRDSQFGHNIMVGIGGVYAEALSDTSFRPTPLRTGDAVAMIGELKHRAVLREFRGLRALDTVGLENLMNGLEAAVKKYPNILSIDINPLIISENGSILAVDALVEMQDVQITEQQIILAKKSVTDEHFHALFNPRGVVVVGASSHPGKFGFVSLHNILASGYSGGVYATNLQGEEVLGVTTLRSLDDLPDNLVDLAFVCTPASANIEILRQCAKKNIAAVFVTSAGYRESSDAGRIAQIELRAEADRLGLLLLGPNGQGVVSTPASLCAQIVAPYPPRGVIAIASQSGNFVSSFLNYSRFTQVGISRAVSAGNAAQVSVGDLLDFYSRDHETQVSLAYIEGIDDGRALIVQMDRAARAKPLVVVKGGATDSGARAAASHTGSLASNDAIFIGVCRQIGATRARTIEEGFDIAATFATQPLPKGPNTVVLTTVGGWGVMTADEISREGVLSLIELPNDLVDALHQLLPARWSKNNPIDCAGGETRDTVPEVLDLLAQHSAVDAIIYLGIGIQSNQGRLMREGRFYPQNGLDRIVSYHERQDERFAQAAHDASQKYAKPILSATELAIADPDNAGVRAIRNTGRLCYSSGNRAATALGHLYLYAKFIGVAS